MRTKVAIVVDYITTTERRTSPRSMLAKAASTSPMPMRSLTNASRSRPALQVQVNEHREIASGQAVAVPRRFKGAAATKHLDERQFDFHRWVRNTDQYDGSSEISGVEGLLISYRVTNGLNGDVDAIAPGESSDGVHRIGLGRVDGVGGPKAPGPFQLAVVDVNGNYGVSASQAGAGDCRVAHATAADDGDGIATTDVAGIHGGAKAGHDAAADEAGGQRTGGRIDLHRLDRIDQRQLAKRADAESRRQRGAVGEGHFLLSVAAGKAIPRTTAQARPAVAAGSAPGEDHEITGLNVRDFRSDFLDYPGRLVSEEKGKLVVDCSLPVVQVGMADAAGLDAHQRLTLRGVGHQDGHEFHGRTLCPRNHTLNFVDRHRFTLRVDRAGRPA